MLVKPGDFVRLTDRTVVRVTSAVDPEHPHVKLCPDDIFLGTIVKYSPVTDKYFYPRIRHIVVNPMSEVVAILDDVVIE